MNSSKSIAFTICSNNYLGQAIALKNSLFRHNPDFSMYIVLVDKRSEAVNYEIAEPAEILPIHDIPGLDVDDLISRYHIIELNTSVKPSVFKHLIQTHPGAEAVYYFDPDLYFYSSLAPMNRKLASASAVLTPHILSPIPRDGLQPEENTFFRFGIYNLGFFGINPGHPETTAMLNWWEERVIHHGYDLPHKGYFVDQLWMTAAPLFFKGILVESEYGYNMAPWNLHEREVESREGNTITLNDGSSLVFYHFSKLSDNAKDISREYDRFSLEDFPLLAELYREYRQELAQCKFDEFKHIPIAFPVRKIGGNRKLSWLGRQLQQLAEFITRISRKV